MVHLLILVIDEHLWEWNKSDFKVYSRKERLSQVLDLPNPHQLHPLPTTATLTMGQFHPSITDLCRGTKRTNTPGMLVFGLRSPRLFFGVSADTLPPLYLLILLKVWQSKPSHSKAVVLATELEIPEPHNHIYGEVTTPNCFQYCYPSRSTPIEA